MLVVTDQSTVWAWGGNCAGQLGLSTSASPPGASPAAAAAAWVAAPLEAVDSSAAAAMGLPTAAACGEEHSVLLSASGQLHAAGSNGSGACGLPLVQLRAAAFSEVWLPPGEAAAAVSCGGRNTAAITASGRLLVCGSNEHGQCGVGRVGDCCWHLADIGPSAAWHGLQRTNQLSGGGFGEAAAGQGVVAAACGNGSLYALTQQGEVFAWGQGGQGAPSGCVHARLCPFWQHQMQSWMCCSIGSAEGLMSMANRGAALAAVQASWGWAAAAGACARLPGWPGRGMPPAWRPRAAAALQRWWMGTAGCSHSGRVSCHAACTCHRPAMHPPG